MITESELEEFVNYFIEEAHKSASSFIGVENGNNNQSANRGI